MRALSTWIDGFIGSAKSTKNKVLSAFGKQIPEMQEYFASDFGGHGWKIYEEGEKYFLEIDNIRVRGNLVAHELVIDKIRAIAGSLGISQACGKVKSVSEDDTAYYLTMEGDETHGYGGFEANDFIRCQRVSVNGVIGYWVKVTEVNSNILKVLKTEFYNKRIQTESDDKEECVTESSIDGMFKPSEGDEIVQYGNATDTTRQSAIYIHANGQGQPAIDILEGIKTKSFANCLTCRLGGNLPDGGGFGLYSKNGKIISKTDDITNYELNPDGTFNLGRDAIKYDGKQVTIGSSVKINWGASSQIGVEYATNTNATIPPTSGWSTDLTKVNPKKGQYLWTRTKYPNGTYSYSVSYMAKDGEDGIPGADGTPMRPNLMDYTSLPQEIFDNKPTDAHFSLNGDRVNGLDGYGAVEAEVYNGTEDEKDVWLFRENVLGRLEPSTWYTLSFHNKGSNGKSMVTHMHSTKSGGETLIDSAEKVIVDGKEQTSSVDIAWGISSGWVRHTYTFKTASTLPSVSFCILFRLYASTAEPTKSVAISQMKLERGKAASEWCMSETDKITSVHLPSWLDDWSGETTSLGADYVAAKNAFFGKKENDKYTGIMMSSDGLEIGGQKVVGLYALNENGVVVAIDPTTQTYRFDGNIMARNGQFNGLHQGFSINGISVFREDNFTNCFDVALGGTSKYYAKPDFFIVNPVMIFTYLPQTMRLSGDLIGGNQDVKIEGVILPSYYVGNSKLDVVEDAQYQTALGFLGKTLHIINITESTLKVNCQHTKANNYYRFMSGDYRTDTDVELENGDISIASGKSLSMTMHMRRDCTLYWVLEDADNNSISLSTGSVGDITILPPSKNDKWYISNRVNDTIS